jgi:hypothetical protein
VVGLALADHERAAVEPLPPRLRALEAQRLAELLAAWLELEAARPPFRVLAREERHRLDIEGLPVSVVVDRVDQLGDGRLAIIDYKSGRGDRSASWNAERITGAAVADLCRAGLSRSRGGGGGAGAGDARRAGLPRRRRRRGPAARREGAGRAAPALRRGQFPDWAALRALWAERLREVAREVKQGTAAVVFRNEADLKYCEVKPLLRLAERRQQWEDGR